MQGKKFSMRKKLTILVCCLIVVVFAGIGTFHYLYNKINTNEIDIVERETTPSKIELSDMTIEEMENAFQHMSEEEMNKIFDDTLSYDNKHSEQTDIYKVKPIDKKIWNVLLIGQDARSEEERARSDTMILFSYNRNEKSVVLTSFLRDTWVPIEGFGYNKLNAGFALGGPGLLVNTINQVYGLDIQNFVVVDFEGLVEIVDAMGGLNLAITPEEAAYYNREFPNDGRIVSGEAVNLTGIQALHHLNNRSIGNSDFQRTQRQRDALLAVYSQLKSVKDAKTVLTLADTVLKNVETNIPASRAISTGIEALGFENINYSEYRVPFDGMCWDKVQNGQSVLMSDLAKNGEKLRELIYGGSDE